MLKWQTQARNQLDFLIHVQNKVLSKEAAIKGHSIRPFNHKMLLIAVTYQILIYLALHIQQNFKTSEKVNIADFFPHFIYISYFVHFNLCVYEYNKPLTYGICSQIVIRFVYFTFGYKIARSFIYYLFIEYNIRENTL